MTLSGRLGAAVLAVCVTTGSTLADYRTGERHDLRDFRIGMTVSELPQQGYGNFTCATRDGTDGTPIEGWAEYTRCAPDEEGLREVRFQYTATRVEFVKAND
jgi:hypothetical protein